MNSVQTELRCEDYDFPAEKIYDLVDHMQRKHTLEDCEFDWRCELFEKGFYEHTDLMVHIQYWHGHKNETLQAFFGRKVCFGKRMQIWQEYELSAWSCVLLVSSYKIVEAEHYQNVKKDNKETDDIIKIVVYMVESFSHRLNVIENGKWQITEERNCKH